MRLSDFTPRINGIVPALTVSSAPGMSGLGAASYDLSGQINMYYNSFMSSLAWNVEHGMAATPDVVQHTLTQAALDSCAAVAPYPCDPSTVADLINTLVAQYTAAYNNQINTTQAQIQAGQIAVPPSYVYVPPTTGDPNALNTVAPTPVVVQTTQTGGNVLNPPVPVPPVTTQQVLNNQTQGGSGAIANGTSASNTSQASNGILDWLTQPISTSIPIPMWAVIAGGVVAVMVMKD